MGFYIDMLIKLKLNILKEEIILIEEWLIELD